MIMKYYAINLHVSGELKDKHVLAAVDTTS